MLATHFSLDNLQEKIKVSIHREYISIFMLYFYELNQLAVIKNMINYENLIVIMIYMTYP